MFSKHFWLSRKTGKNIPSLLNAHDKAILSCHLLTSLLKLCELVLTEVCSFSRFSSYKWWKFRGLFNFSMEKRMLLIYIFYNLYNECLTLLESVKNNWVPLSRKFVNSFVAHILSPISVKMHCWFEVSQTKECYSILHSPLCILITILVYIVQIVWAGFGYWCWVFPLSRT